MHHRRLSLTSATLVIARRLIDSCCTSGNIARLLSSCTHRTARPGLWYLLPQRFSRCPPHSFPIDHPSPGNTFFVNEIRITSTSSNTDNSVRMSTHTLLHSGSSENRYCFGDPLLLSCLRGVVNLFQGGTLWRYVATCSSVLVLLHSVGGWLCL